jgi:fibro-slime domain-containing protein
MASNDPDTQKNYSPGTMYNTSIGGGLGPDGLPVLNAAGAAFFVDHNASNELTWWSTQDPTVSVLNNPVYPPTISLPFSDSNMYTNTTILGANGDDSQAFLTASFAGAFNLPSPSSVTFNVCSDDDELVYLSGGIFGGGTMVVDNGGIHATSCASGNVNTTLLSNVAAGNYTISIFYADRQRVGATFSLTSTLDIVPVTGVPEPGTILLLCSGLSLLWWTRRGKRA